VKTVAVTQRVAVLPERAERRDCLDQAWSRFLAACGLRPLLLPNVREVALELCTHSDLAGLLLTGGNDLAALGGDAPERDTVENALLDMAEQRALPVLGVCRGMQLLQQRSGVPLRRVEGHVTAHQTIDVNGIPRNVNAYHCFAAFESHEPYSTWAVARDGVIKAVRHRSLPVTGIMWHPERTQPPATADIELFRRIFLQA
jgi:N5-(cytidine 5'-diphosphoramidyl)-L-glutamine hydrolase